MPLFFLSGALFPLNNLPSVLLWITKFNPLSYGIDALRTILIGTGVYSIYLDVGVLIGVTAIILAIGSYLFSKIEV